MPMSMTPPSTDDRSNHLQRQVIGFLGLLLPWLLPLIAGLRPTEGIGHAWKLLPSVSAYYHTGAVVVFVGVLAALAVFLLTYLGYRNQGWKDQTAAIIAGVAATIVALFPTAVPPGVRRPTWWTERIGLIHGIAATVLFATFIFFSLFLFTQSSAARPSPGKRARNTIYIVCGLAMIVCTLWAIVAGLRKAPIFWPETLSLEFFAISWLTKGRVDWTARAVVSRAIHPRRNSYP